jgi:hypothetical protein
MPPTWHFTTWLDLFDHWQTVIAGFLALLAAVGTIWVTRHIANKQITVSREEADKVIAATRAQTDTTVRMARNRDENEYVAFRIMLHAAMTQVLAEAVWARKTYPRTFTQTTPDEASVEAYAVRTCITKGAFAELRGACIRQRSPLTHEFLYLEGEIDNFALQVGTYAFSGRRPCRSQKASTPVLANSST